MKSIEIDVEQIVKQQVVADILSKVSTEDRNTILEKSLTETLNNSLGKYQVQNAIKEDVERYMAEYIQRPEIQTRIKASVEKAFDRILDGMVLIFEEQIEQTIKNKYKQFSKRSDPA